MCTNTKQLKIVDSLENRISGSWNWTQDFSLMRQQGQLTNQPSFHYDLKVDSSQPGVILAPKFGLRDVGLSLDRNRSKIN